MGKGYAKYDIPGGSWYTRIFECDGIGRAIVERFAAEGARMVSEVVEKFGRLDIAVCNAGIEIRRPFLEVTDEEWERVIGVNLYGAFVVARA